MNFIIVKVIPLAVDDGLVQLRWDPKSLSYTYPEYQTYWDAKEVCMRSEGVYPISKKDFKPVMPVKFWNLLQKTYEEDQ